MSPALVVRVKNISIAMEPLLKTMKQDYLPKRTEYENALRQTGLRITRQRRLILDIILKASDHPNAVEIFRRASHLDKGLSLSTVYRTMRALEECGAIQRHAFDGGPSRFEQAGNEHHDHLIDIDSGKVVEFHSDVIERLQEEIAHQLGYDIVHHRLEIYGRKRKD